MSGGGTNTIQTQSVPDWLQPFLTSALYQGQNLLNTGGPQFYPGQQVAGLTPMQEQGITEYWEHGRRAECEPSRPTAKHEH